MFHLMVQFRGWQANRDALPSERVLKYTKPPLVTRFKPDGQFDIELIAAIPALLMSEIDGKGSQDARIGAVHRVEPQGQSVAIHYALDPHLPAIPSRRLEKLALQLDIDPFEFKHTHWAIKDVDLYKVLLGAQLKPPVLPKVFTINATEEIDESLVSVMMPFDARFNDVYAAVRDAAKELGLRCERADDIWEHDAIVQDIVSLIYRSRLVICDLSTRNSNVFYEAGIAHSLGRDVVLITQNADDVPFDLRHLRFAKYLNNAEGRLDLAQALKSRIKTIIAGNPSA